MKFIQPKKEVKFTPMKMKPMRLVALTFVVLIIIGTFFLYLPISSVSGKPTDFFDALFTATSAVCVTGLAVVTTADHWSIFGKSVIIFLILIGGLGLMTILTMFSVLAGRKITLRQRLIIRDSFNQEGVAGMVRLLKYIFKFTIMFEGILAVILIIRFSFDYPLGAAIGNGIFHSVSAFCNAGFDLFGTDSLTRYRGDFVVNLSTMVLIIAGGLGFPVWMDINDCLARIIKEKHSFKSSYTKMQLHTKLVLLITAALLVFSAVFFFAVEYRNPLTLGQLSFKDKIFSSCFQAVTTRTAGFATIDQGQMTYSSKFMTIILMFIGGSPSSTAGGVKTTTMGILLAAVYSIIKGEQQVHLFGRSIKQYNIQKALAVLFLGQMTIILSTMLLSITENTAAGGFAFIDLFFETTSAFGTVGLSLGRTGELSNMGKLVLSFVMFIGRLGPISLASAITVIHFETKNYLEYPDGKIIIG